MGTNLSAYVVHVIRQFSSLAETKVKVRSSSKQSLALPGGILFRLPSSHSLGLYY